MDANQSILPFQSLQIEIIIIIRRLWGGGLLVERSPGFYSRSAHLVSYDIDSEARFTFVADLMVF